MLRRSTCRRPRRRGVDPRPRPLPRVHARTHVVRRLQLADLAFVAPAADDATWYPNSFLAPLADNQPRLDFALQRMAALRDQLLGEGTPPHRIVWFGFSQGACLVSQFLSTDPRRWGGLIALTGGLIGPPGTEWTFGRDSGRRDLGNGDRGGDFAGMPAYFSTSEADPFVPEDRVRETAARFAAAGAHVTVEFHLGRGHEIADAEIDRAAFILTLLPTLAAVPQRCSARPEGARA